MKFIAPPSWLLLCATLLLPILPASAQKVWVQHLKVKTQNMSYDSVHQQFLGAGNETIWITDDGGLWYGRTAQGTHQDVIFANNLYVAVGSRVGKKSINTSSNAISWTVQNFAGNGSFNGICYALGNFWVVGDGGEVLKSPTATNWKTVPIPTALRGNFRSIAFLNNQLVISGLPGKVVVSSNGTSWTGSSLPSDAKADIVQGTAYGNGLYVATTAAGEVFSSTNLKTWNKQADLTFSASRVLYVPDPVLNYPNGVFVITGSLESIATSADGLVWDVIQQEFSPFPMESMAFGESLLLTGSPEGALYNIPDTPYNYYEQTDTSFPWQMVSMAFGNGYFLGVGWGLGTAIWKPLETWHVEVPLPTLPIKEDEIFDYQDVDFGNDAFHLAGYDYIDVYDNTANFSAFISLAALYDDRTAKQIADGVKDTFFIPLQGIDSGDGYTVAVSFLEPYSGFYVWTDAGLNAFPTAPLAYYNSNPPKKLGWWVGKMNNVAWGKGFRQNPSDGSLVEDATVFVVVGDGGTIGVICPDADSVSVFKNEPDVFPMDPLSLNYVPVGYPDNRASGTLDNLIDVVYVPGFGFYALGETGVVTYSVNGRYWRSLQIDNLGTDVPSAIRYGNDRFVVVCRSGAIFSSIDGLKWSKEKSPIPEQPAASSQLLMGLAFGDGRFSSIGREVAISSTDEVLPPDIQGATTAQGSVDADFIYKFKVLDGGDSLVLTATGLPPGLSLVKKSIQGIPTQAGTFNTTITATNSGGKDELKVKIKILPLQPPVISGQTDVFARQDKPFVYTFKVTNPVDSVTLTGTLPAGLVFNANGRKITGIPTTVGVANVTIVATNGGGTTQFPITITVIDKNLPTKPPVINSPKTATATVNKSFTYTITAKGQTDSFGVTGPLPPGTKFDPATASITGKPTAVGTYDLVLSATNIIGTDTSPLTITVTDDESPTMSDFDPKGRTVVTERLTLRVSGKAHDNLEVASVQFSVRKGGGAFSAPKNAKLTGQSKTKKDFSFSVDLPTKASYEVQFYAVDSSGNTSPKRIISVERTDADPVSSRK